MYHFVLKTLLWIFLAFNLSPFLPVVAGSEDGGFFDGDNGGAIVPFFAIVPVFMPDLDQHRGRGIVQLPPTALPLALKPPLLLQGKPEGQKGEPKEFLKDPYSEGESPSPEENDGNVPEDNSESSLFNEDAPNDFPLPLAGPDGDQDQGRGAKCDGKKKGLTEFPHRLKEPREDNKYGREVITLDAGSPDNPYQICDHGLFYIGALIGVGFIEPNSLVQFNALAKFKLTKGNSSHRRAENYREGIKRKWAKYPKKVEDFEEWATGDWIRRHGLFSIAFYVGAAYFGPDVRGGVTTEVASAIHYQKVSPDIIRVSITKEGGGGGILRGQILPYQKAEFKDIGNYEKARVYLFDLAKDNERKALDDLVQRNVIFSDSEAKDAVKHGDATQLTSRTIKRHKTTFTPVQLGIPVLARARKTYSTDRYRSKVTTRRGVQYNFTAKAYYRHGSYRHKNFKKFKGSHKGKKRRYYMDMHRNYNRGFQGGVAKIPKIKKRKDNLTPRMRNDGKIEFTQEFEKRSGIRGAEPGKNVRYIHVQRSFSHDRVEAKQVNHYLKKFLRKAGVNHHMVDVGYKSKAMIGYAELRWDLRVGPAAIEDVAKIAQEEKHPFRQTANELIDDYFGTLKQGYKNDPHNLCRSSTLGMRLCVADIRWKTQRELNGIASKLRKIQTKKYQKSSEKTASLLAKIAKSLGKNQFILQAFILTLPINEEGYGRLQVYGERFLGREFNTDPGQKMRPRNSIVGDSEGIDEAVNEDDEDPNLHDFDDVSVGPHLDPSEEDDDALGFNWQRINKNDDMNEL